MSIRRPFGRTVVGVADGDHELEFDGRYGRRDTVEQHCGEYLFWKSWRIKITVVSQMNQFGLKVNIPFLTVHVVLQNNISLPCFVLCRWEILSQSMSLDIRVYSCWQTIPLVTLKSLKNITCHCYIHEFYLLIAHCVLHIHITESLPNF